MAVQCSKCQKSFRIQADYNRHRKQHDRPFKCVVCLKVFSLKTNLDRHRLSHIETEKKWTVQCSWPGCKMKTVREDYLRKHMMKSHLKTQMTGIPAEIVRLEAKVETLYQQSVRKGRASVATLRVAKFRPTLHEAVAKGDEEEVSRMVANGADVNAQIPSLDVSEDYSIRMATGKNWQEIPLSLSVLNRHENIFRILLDINPSRKSLLWAFHACIRTENCVLADELIKRGVDVNEIDTERGNCYPLEIAAAGNHKEILELLLRRGAITEPSSNPMEGSPLMIAAGQGHANSVRLLLENGAAINHEGGIYGTALGAASFHGKEGVAKSLLEKGANPNIRSKYYGTSLARARFWNRPGIEAVLMQYGATE